MQLARLRKAILTDSDTERLRIERAAADIGGRCFKRLIEDGQIFDVGELDDSIAMLGPLSKNFRKIEKWLKPNRALPLWVYLSSTSAQADFSADRSYVEQAAVSFAPIIKFLTAIKRFERRCLRAEKEMVNAREKLRQRQITSNEEVGIEGPRSGQVPQVAVAEAIRDLYSLWCMGGKLLGPRDAFREFVEAVLQPWPNGGKKTKSYKREVSEHWKDARESVLSRVSS